MPTLVIMRHSRAERPLGCPDVDRPLSESGRADALVAADMLASRSGTRATVALVSPSQRTRETWAIVAPRLPHARALIEPGLYEAEADEVLECAAERAIEEREACETLIIVGHNPAMHESALALLAGTPGIPPELGRRFPTSAFARIRLSSWSTLPRGDAVLEDFAIPRASSD